MNARCFFLTETDQVKRALRRYSKGGGPNVCAAAGPSLYSYHDATVPLDIVPEAQQHDQADRSLPGWPTHCRCGYEFLPTDEWQTWKAHLWRRVDTGETMTLRDAPAGAMWFADWMLPRTDGWFIGPDGHCLMIRLFHGDDFCPDQRAANCTLPGDDTHKCWVRVGGVPNITIGKGDGSQRTCGAGAGSFFSGRIYLPDGTRTEQFKWHGFCRNGELVEG